MNKDELVNFGATEINSIIGKRGRKNLVWRDGVNGLIGTPVSYAAPVAASFYLGKNIKLDGRPVDDNDSGKTVIEVPLKTLEKTSQIREYKEGIYKQAASLNNLNHRHNYLHSYETTILKDGLVGPAIRGSIATIPFLIAAHATGRNFRNYGEKIDTSDAKPLDKGKARIIIETKNTP